MVRQDWNLISSYVGLLSLATFSVYTGSFGSLKTPRKPRDVTTSKDDSEDEDEEDMPDRLSSSDALLFPIIGSVVLFGLYLVVKFFGVEWINWLLGWYFTIAGVGSVWKACSCVQYPYAKVPLDPSVGVTFTNGGFLFERGPKLSELITLSIRTPSLVLFVPSIIPSFLYTYQPGPKKSALLTDILALSFSHNALSIMKLDTFQTGVILLSGLFLYDIWWVFGTEVMVKVATSLDAPIKILWPKSYVFSPEGGFTMLGLGDIVIPGMFVSTALRYDLSKSAHKDPRQPFAKPYFHAAVTAYVLGLATTMAVLHVFGAAQPALLYLSPACILTFLATAITKGEITDAWKWKDEAEASSDDGAAKSYPKSGPGASEGSNTMSLDLDGAANDGSDGGGSNGIRKRNHAGTTGN